MRIPLPGPAALLPLTLLVAACGATPAPPPAAPKSLAQTVFEATAPSVVAILNDDRADREQETRDMEKTLGDESHAPKHVIDVSPRKEPQPHGTGFAILDPQTHDLEIITAAHVVLRPDRLKLTTRDGQTVAATVARIDEVRDVAILTPSEPLKGVVPLALADANPEVGAPVWAMGHTGQGYWALSWGMSQGIASGVVDMFGEKLLLFDAAVYPGFSGGPVVTLGPDGKPRIVGVNHAILFTGASASASPIGPISSAVSIGELREVTLGHPPAVEATMAAYAKQQRGRKWADLFVTDRISVSRDDEDQPVAAIAGNAHEVDVDDDGSVRIPAVAMLFGLDAGPHDVTFEVHDLKETVLATDTTTVRLGPKQRVAFASTSMQFVAKSHGKHSIVAKEGDRELGRAFVNLSLPHDDDDQMDEADPDATDDGDPDVDVVVAALGQDDPLAMIGIRADWSERTYPRRVQYAWFARGTRGWTGTNVSISSYVLDTAGHIVGRNEGCFQPEVRPEHAWSCMGEGGGMPFPMASVEGPYDIVFAINDRPVAWWPMEAVMQVEHAPGSDLSRWTKEMQRVVIKRRRQSENNAAGTPPGSAAGAGATKPPAKKKP